MAKIDELKLAELQLAEIQISEKKLTDLMKKLEKEGMEKLQKLQKTASIVPPKKGLMNIMQSGANEFEKTMGRPMSYGEMRDMYG